MTVKQQFLSLQTDVINNLDNRFVKYLDASLSIMYTGPYPQEYEEYLLSGTYNSMVKVNNLLYNPYSEEFLDIRENGDFEREYIVNFSFVHNYCFEMFCVYFDMVAHGISDDTSKTYFDQYEYFLEILVNTTNLEYNDSYRLYWREIILRINHVLKNGGHLFHNLFNAEQRKVLINNLESVYDKLTKIGN